MKCQRKETYKGLEERDIWRVKKRGVGGNVNEKDVRRKVRERRKKRVRESSKKRVRERRKKMGLKKL